MEPNASSRSVTQHDLGCISESTGGSVFYQICKGVLEILQGPGRLLWLVKSCDSSFSVLNCFWILSSTFYEPHKSLDTCGNSVNLPDDSTGSWRWQHLWGFIALCIFSLRWWAKTNFVLCINKKVSKLPNILQCACFRHTLLFICYQSTTFPSSVGWFFNILKGYLQQTIFSSVHFNILTHFQNYTSW